MRSARGFTLIEVAVAVAVVVLIATGAVAASMSARSLAVSSAATRFDALLDGARTAAREFDGGATIVFEPDAYGDGFTAQVYGRRPSSGPLITTDFPSYDGRVALTETALLGTPAFALALHANGKLGGIIGDVLHGNAGPENACPASGAYVLVFTYGNAKATRTLPCTIDLAATGPIAYLSPSPATPAPTPTVPACAATGCINTPPPSPNVVTTCPPGYTQTNPTMCVLSTSGAQTSTCPPGYEGIYPNCSGDSPPTATPTPLLPEKTESGAANAACIPDNTHAALDACSAFAEEMAVFTSPTDSVSIKAQVTSNITFAGADASDHNFGNSSIFLAGDDPTTGNSTLFCLASTVKQIQNSSASFNSSIILPYGPGTYTLELSVVAAADLPLDSIASGNAQFEYSVSEANAGSGIVQPSTTCP